MILTVQVSFTTKVKDCIYNKDRMQFFAKKSPTINVYARSEK